MQESVMRLLAEVMERHGADWEISKDASVWTALRRPRPTAVHILVAHTLPELSEKLERTSGS
jgi:hypothetical protein